MSIAAAFTKEGRFGSQHVKVNDAVHADIDPKSLLALLEEKMALCTGALYVYKPLIHPLNSGPIDYALHAFATKTGLVWKPHLSTARYSIVYVWCGEGEDRVPAFATSIAGAAACLLSHDGKEVLLVRAKGSRKYGFAGGAVDFAESDRDALLRELREELGLKLSHCDIRGRLGGYNQVGARCYGVFDGGDPAVYVGDHWSAFEVRINRNARFSLQVSELEEATWFDVADVIAEDSDIPIFSFNRELLAKTVVPGYTLMSVKSAANSDGSLNEDKDLYM